MILQSPAIDFLKRRYVIILISLLALALGVSVELRGNTTAWIAINVAALVLLAYVILFKKKYLLLLVAFLIPISVPLTTGIGAVSFPSEIICFIITAFVIFLSLKKFSFDRKILTHPITIFLLVDILWYLITSLLSTIPEVSFKRTFIRINYLVVYYFLMIALFRNQHNIVRVFLLYGAGLIYPVASTMIYHSRFNFQVGGSYEMTKPFFNDHTIYGACIAFILPIIFLFLLNRDQVGLKNRSVLFLIPLFVLLVLAEILSFSRAAWLSVVFAFLFTLVLKLKIKFRTLLILLLMAGVAGYGFRYRIMDAVKQNESSVLQSRSKESNMMGMKEHVRSVTNISTDVSNTERLNRWNCAIRMFLDKPFTGFGPGTYQFQYGNYQQRSDMTRISTFSGNKGHAHSEYLNNLSETGIIGFANYLVLLLIVVARSLRIIHSPGNKKTKIIAVAIFLGILTYIFHGFFNAFLDIDKMAMLFLGGLAAITATDIYHKKNEPDP